MSIQHFQHFCEVHPLQLWTDHKPLVTALSRVAAPISPCQQHYLAFISEFNVQMLYLLGLQTVITYFSSHHSPPPKLTGDFAATAATTSIDFAEMDAEQSRCPEMQRFLIGSSLSIDFQQVGAHCLLGDVSTVIFQLVVLVKLRKDIFFICTISQDDGFPPIILFHPGTCGAPWLKTWWPGPRPACTVSRARPTATSRPGLFTSRTPSDIFPTFTSTWWACYNLLIIAISYLPSLTLHPTG